MTFISHVHVVKTQELITSNSPEEYLMPLWHQYLHCSEVVDLCFVSLDLEDAAVSGEN